MKIAIATATKARWCFNLTFRVVSEVWALRLGISRSRLWKRTSVSSSVKLARNSADTSRSLLIDRSAQRESGRK